MKTKLFIAPDKVICDEIEALSFPIFSQIQISELDLGLRIYLIENRYFKSGVSQRKILKTYDIPKDLPPRIVYRSTTPSLNTDDFGDTTLLAENTQAGIIDKYISASNHSGHISLFRERDTILVKTNFPTLFVGLYPMIVNSNFHDIIVKEFPHLEDHIKGLKEDERRFLGRNISER